VLYSGFGSSRRTPKVPLIGEERAQERAQHGARQLRGPGEKRSERVRQRQNPLSNRNLGQNSLDEVSSCVRHAPPASRSTEA
jgi:hypothetical protein